MAQEYPERAVEKGPGLMVETALSTSGKSAFIRRSEETSYFTRLTFVATRTRGSAEPASPFGGRMAGMPSQFKWPFLRHPKSIPIRSLPPEETL